MATPEIDFYEHVREVCRLARKRAKDPRESRAAADLEIEIGERIKRFEEAEKQMEPVLATGTEGRP